MDANGGGGALEDGGGHALANGGRGQALHLAFLRLPAQEIARCRTVCRQWRAITRTESFCREHHRHRCRRPMALLLYPTSGRPPCTLHAADGRYRVTRPVIRFPINRGVLRIHGSCAGILLLSLGNRLYACNPCTRRWARLPPLHVHNRIIGFYSTGIADLPGFGCHVLFDNRQEHQCTYWIFRLAAGAAARFIGRPAFVAAAGLDLVLANGIAPYSCQTPPVHFRVFLFWLPRAGQGTSNILRFDTIAEFFSSIPPPTIQVDGEDIQVVGESTQLLEMHDHLAMALFLPTRVHVWVRCNITNLWSHRYRIRLLMDPNVAPTGVFAVARDRSRLMESPYVLLPYDGIFLSGHTIQESLLQHPSILPLQGTHAVHGDPPFFHNQ